MNTDKRDTRQHLLQVRRSLNERERAEFSRDITAHLLSSDLFRKAPRLFAYASLPEEADVDGIAEAAWALGKPVAFPKTVDAEGNMVFCFTERAEDLVPGRFGVREPKNGREAMPSGNDLILVPGIAFDENGFRLGYGKGYYDRYLEQVPGIRVGICFEALLLPVLPREEHDCPVDYLVTETGWRKMFRRKTETEFRQAGT